MEPQPFSVEGYSDEENAAIEVIDESGLTTRMPGESLRVIQDLIGAINSSILTGSLVKILPPPPEGFVEGMQEQVAGMRVRRTLFKIKNSLPSRWEMRHHPETGRVYFVDDVQKSTSWEPPEECS